MKNLLLILLALLPLVSFGQKYELNENGEYEERKVPIRTYELPDEIELGENATKEDLDVFVVAKKDTTYAVDESQSIIAVSWYVATKTTAEERSLSMSEETLVVEVNENPTVVNHEVLTTLLGLMLLFLAASCVIPAWLKRILAENLSLENYQKKSIAIFVTGIFVAIMGYLGWGFEGAVIGLNAGITAVSLVLAMDRVERATHAEGLLGFFVLIIVIVVGVIGFVACEKMATGFILMSLVLCVLFYLGHLIKD